MKKLPGFKIDFESTDKVLPLHQYLWSEISRQWNNGPLIFFFFLKFARKSLLLFKFCQIREILKTQFFWHFQNVLLWVILMEMKVRSGFHARKNPKQQNLKAVTSYSVMLHSAKSAYMFTTMQPKYTLNRPSSAWESFNIRQKLGLFVLRVTKLTYWIFPQFVSNRLKWVDGSSTLTVWRYHLAHEISIFVKIFFNFKKKLWG